MAVFDEQTKALPKTAKKVFSGVSWSVWQWQQCLYDGTYATFEKLSRADTAHTVGVLPNGKILLAWDEQPDRGPVITPAGGVLEPGESPVEGAKREFREETGYEIGKLKDWHTYCPSSKMAWKIHAFIGQELIKRGDPQPESGEKIELLELSWEEFLALGSNPRMRDLVIRLILLEAIIDPKKQVALKSMFYE